MAQKTVLFLMAFSISVSVSAATPRWVINDTHPKFAVSKAACSPVNGNASTAKVIAEAKAKGAISQAIGGKVTATSTLSKHFTDATGGNGDGTEQYSERIEIKSSHHLNSVQRIEGGLFDIGNTPHYCVWMGI